MLQKQTLDISEMTHFLYAVAKMIYTLSGPQIMDEFCCIKKENTKPSDVGK